VLADHLRAQRAALHVLRHALAQQDAAEVFLVGAIGALGPGAAVGVVVEHARNAALGQDAQVLDAGDHAHGAALLLRRAAWHADGSWTPDAAAKRARRGGKNLRPRRKPRRVPRSPPARRSARATARSPRSCRRSRAAAGSRAMPDTRARAARAGRADAARPTRPTRARGSGAPAPPPDRSPRLRA